MTPAAQADIKHAQYLTLSKNSVLVADRAYMDFKMLYGWVKDNITFVLRLKKSIKFNSLEEKQLPEKVDEQIIVDEIIELSKEQTKELYPDKLRRVVVYDSENNQTIELITNNFTWTALTISELYKQRWQIEILFKELKQHLKIKSFIGTNENAMFIQIWTALITLLLLNI